MNLIAEILNLKSLKKDLPEEFKDVYDRDKYLKTQEYTRVRTKFGFISSIFSLITLLIFWFAGGFNYLDIIVRGYSESEIIRGLCYIGILMAAQMILSLPFSIYSTFVIEERFGFNKTTPTVFALDRVKSIGLGILIGAPVLAGVIYILLNAGGFAWLYGWAGVTLISLILQFIAPTWIMPLFNKFKPLEEGALKSAIFDFAGKVSFPLRNVFVMDGSKRSTKSNAFFTGFGKNKRIALFDTLIEKHTTEELVAVLAHEIGHYKKKHILKSMVYSFFHTGIIFYFLSIFLGHKGMFDAFYMENMSVYAGLIFFGMLYSPVEMILSVVMNISSRKNEFEADNFAGQNTGKPESMISALKKLSSDNLSNLTPHKFYVFLNYSHPPVLERINAIKAI